MKKIGGDSGKANGPKVLEPLVHAIIEPKMLAKISLTDRAGKGKAKKEALSKHGSVVRLITSLCEIADITYKPEESSHDLKYAIIKYAQGKFGENGQVDSLM